MKKNRLILFVICMLLLIPCISYAVEGDPASTEPTPTESPEPTTSPTPTEEPEPSPTPVVVNLSLNKTELTMTINDKETLILTKEGTSEEISWTSGNVNVARVIDGKVTATGVGETTITATVAGKSATCKVTVKEKTAEVPKGTDATLKSVAISGGKLDKTFKSDIFEYKVILDDGNKAINLSSYTKTDSKAKVSEFKTDNSVKLVVTSEDEKTTNTYIFTVFSDEISLNLKSLSINGYAFNEEFSLDKTKYTANIPYEVDTLTINAVPEADSSKVTVTITGDKNLKLGDNQIKITVKDNKGNTKTYEIIANRNKEVTMDGNPTSIITSQANMNSAATSGTMVDDTNNNGEDGFLKYFIVSVACFILFAIGGIGIYFYLKTSPRKLKKELANINRQKQEVEESPIIIVDEEKPTLSSDKAKNIEIFDEVDLMATKQFKKEELDEMIEELDFKDEEDV